MHAKHTLFAFNILLPAAAPLPDGTGVISLTDAAKGDSTP
jgi:hypothetical protein